TTDCAPVTFSGGTWRRMPATADAAGACEVAEGAGLRAEGPGRAVGALTVFSLLLVVHHSCFTLCRRGVGANTV
ncbi:MAG: hypothetical protein ACRD0P_31090, partial [Stackebrandtia sp.]